MHIDDIAKEWEPQRARERYEKVARERDAMREQLRDKFAMAALTGYVSLPDNRTYKANLEQSLDEWRSELAMNDAKYCYSLADAMLKTRGE